MAMRLPAVLVVLFPFRSVAPPRTPPAPPPTPPVNPPTNPPTNYPVMPPTNYPTTPMPTNYPVTTNPTNYPVTSSPTEYPVTMSPTDMPTNQPVTSPPTNYPVTPNPTTTAPSDMPTSFPVTAAPTKRPVTEAPASASPSTSTPITNNPVTANPTPGTSATPTMTTMAPTYNLPPEGITTSPTIQETQDPTPPTSEPPTVAGTQATAPPTPLPAGVASVEAALVFADVSTDDLPSNFAAKAVSAIASRLNVEPAQIRDVQVMDGSVVVRFRIIAVSGVAEALAAQLDEEVQHGNIIVNNLLPASVTATVTTAAPATMTPVSATHPTCPRSRFTADCQQCNPGHVVFPACIPDVAPTCNSADPAYRLPVEPGVSAGFDCAAASHAVRVANSAAAKTQALMALRVKCPADTSAAAREAEAIAHSFPPVTNASATSPPPPICAEIPQRGGFAEVRRLAEAEDWEGCLSLLGDLHEFFTLYTGGQHKSRCMADIYNMVGFCSRKRPGTDHAGLTKAADFYRRALRMDAHHCEAMGYYAQLLATLLDHVTDGPKHHELRAVAGQLRARGRVLCGGHPDFNMIEHTLRDAGVPCAVPYRATPPAPTNCIQAEGRDFSAAICALSEHHYAQALTLLGELEEANADIPRCEADAHNLQGFLARSRTPPDYGEAHRRYSEALRLDPEHCQALGYLGQLHIQQSAPTDLADVLSRFSRSVCNGTAEHAELLMRAELSGLDIASENGAVQAENSGDSTNSAVFYVPIIALVVLSIVSGFALHRHLRRQKTAKAMGREDSSNPALPISEKGSAGGGDTSRSRTPPKNRDGLDTDRIDVECAPSTGGSQQNQSTLALQGSQQNVGSLMTHPGMELKLETSCTEGGSETRSQAG